MADELVTDPRIIAQLEAHKRASASEDDDVVTDPKIIAQLEAQKQPFGATLPWYEKAGRGVGSSIVKTIGGVADLVGADEWADEIRRRQELNVEGTGGWGTAGEITGDILQMAVPAAGAAKLGRLSSVAGASGRLARAVQAAGRPIGQGVVGATTLAGLRTPEDDARSRLGNMAREGALAAAGGYVGGKLISGITRTKAAQKAIDRGQYLTPGQVGENPFWRNIETAMEVTPVAARGTRKAQDRAAQEFNKTALNRALPPGAAPITATGQAGFKQLDDAINQAYAEAWGLAQGTGNKALINAMGRAYTKGPGSLGGKSRRVIKQLMREIEDITDAKSIDRAFREALQSSRAKKDILLGRALRRMRRDWRGSFADDVQGAVREVDKQFPKYLALERAVNYAAGKEGQLFTPKQLVQASKAVGKRAAARGESPMMDIATEGVETTAHVEGVAPLSFFRRLAGVFPGLPGMQATGQAITGQTRPQMMLQRAARAAAPVGVTPASVAAALDTEEDF